MIPGSLFRKFLDTEAGLVAQDVGRNILGLADAGAAVGSQILADIPGGINAGLAALGGDQDPSWHVDRAREQFGYVPRTREGMEYLQSAAQGMEWAGDKLKQLPGAPAAQEGWRQFSEAAPMPAAVLMGVAETFGPDGKIKAAGRGSKAAVEAVERVNRLQNRMPAPQDALEVPGMREDLVRVGQENRAQLDAEAEVEARKAAAIADLERVRQRANAPQRAALESEFLGRDDDYWDIKSDEHGSQFRKSGHSGVSCTGYACEIKEKLGKDRVKVYGFDTQDNPTPRLEGHPGHDFAVVDGRYIVDPWLSDVEMTGKGVYDLHDPADAAEIRDVYGDPAKWGALGEKPLAGMADEVKYDGRTVKQAPHAPAQIAASAYRARTGIGHEAPRKYVKADPEQGAKIARAYEEMPHAPDDPDVVASYNALIDETLDQWREIEKTGLKVEFIPPGAADPYPAGPRGAIEDVRNNNHLWVYPTDAGYGEVGADLGAISHPLLRPTDVVVGGKPLLANDVFRIVHDYFGHIKEGNGFRADGEETAWAQHAAMYSERARGAMTSETRGQNSWLNWGPFGEKNRTASTADTTFAEQKAGLLPREYWSDEALGLKPKAAPQSQMKVRLGDGHGVNLLVNPDAAAIARAGGKLKTLHGSDGNVYAWDPGGALHVRVAEALERQGVKTDAKGWADKSGPSWEQGAAEAGREAEDFAAQLNAAPAGDATINIGLNIGDKVGALKPAKVAKELKKIGVDLLDSSVVVSPTGERTLTGTLSRPLTKAEGDLLSGKLGQEAIAQRTGKAGELLGPKAAEWGPFNPEYFADAPAYERRLDERMKRALDKNPELRAVYERVLPHLTDEEAARLRPQGARALQHLLADTDAGTIASADDLAMMASLGRAKRGWYEHSAQALLDVFGQEDAPRFVALLSALSPQTGVEDNLTNALRVWKGWTAAGRPVDKGEILRIMGESVQGDKGVDSVMDAWRNNSVTALTHPDPRNVRLSGPKVNSFAANLRGVMNEVTNDTWMAEAIGVTQQLFAGTGLAGLDPKGFGGKGIGYMFSNTLTRQAADLLTKATGTTWTPAEVQETVWSWVKTVVEKRRSAGTQGDILAMAAQVTDDEIAGTPDFATLLRQGEHGETLRQAGYGERLNLLAQQPPKASAPYPARTGSLERVAARLERQYQAGKEQAVRGAPADRKQRGAVSTRLLAGIGGAGLLGAWALSGDDTKKAAEKQAKLNRKTEDLLREMEQ